MAGNSTEIRIDLDDAEQVVEDLPDATRSGMRQAVRQITVLAESAFKAEAPEGAGDDVHMRDTVTTEFSRGGLTGSVFARKKVGDGIPLAAIVTGKIEPSWSWGPDGVNDPGPETPPISALMPWAMAKVGDPSFAFYLRWKLVEEGYNHTPFVDDAVDRFEGQVEGIASRQLQEALEGI